MQISHEFIATKLALLIMCLHIIRVFLNAFQGPDSGP